jgi:hypothetical protein
LIIAESLDEKIGRRPWFDCGPGQDSGHPHNSFHYDV